MTPPLALRGREHLQLSTRIPWITYAMLLACGDATHPDASTTRKADANADAGSMRLDGGARETATDATTRKDADTDDAHADAGHDAVGEGRTPDAAADAGESVQAMDAAMDARFEATASVYDAAVLVVDAATDAGDVDASDGAAGEACGVSLGDIVFEDVTVAAGIDVPHAWMPESAYLAIGQGWADLDRDGYLDLLMTGGLLPAKLYRNAGDGTFNEWPILPSLAKSALGGVSFADFDNDGWLDVYLANLGTNQLLHNQGGTALIDVAQTAGVAESAFRGETGSWGDYDRDGWLDLYVANHDLDRDGLYHGEGGGTFSDVSDLVPVGPPDRPAFITAWLDYDDDGDLDLYVINDHLRKNILWRNDGPGCGSWCFADVSESSGAGVAANGMGIAILDYDGDGDLDMYSSDIQRAWLLQNQTAQGSPTFVDVTVDAHVDWLGTSWGTVAADFDNDSHPDLYLTTSDDRIELSDRLFRNRGNGTFDDVSNGAGASDTLYTLGVAAADYDNDGFVDMVIGNRDEGYHLLRNTGQAGVGNHWSRIRLVGDTSADPGGTYAVNRDAIGTRVTLELSNGRELVQELSSGGSLGAGNDLSLHFGLGCATAIRARVRWPDGAQTEHSPVPLDQEWTAHYPSE
jgi:hypothetical protein